MAQEGDSLSQLSAASQGTRGIYDDELVAAAQAGNSEAMEQLFTRHRSQMLRAAARLTSSPEEAEDVVQDAMLRAFQNIGRFRKEARFTTWLTVIVNNSALSLKRKTSRVRWTSFESAFEGEDGTRTWDPPDPHRTPEEQALDQEMFSAVAAITLRLPAKHRAILRACIFNGRSMSEAAVELDLTVASVKSRLRVARHCMVKAFAERLRVHRTDFRKSACAFDHA